MIDAYLQRVDSGSLAGYREYRGLYSESVYILVNRDWDKVTLTGQPARRWEGWRESPEPKVSIFEGSSFHSALEALSKAEEALRIKAGIELDSRRAEYVD